MPHRPAGIASACLQHATLQRVRKDARTNIQIRGASSALLEKLRARARSKGKTMSQYAMEVLQKDLAYPSLEDWLDEVREQRIPVRGGMTGAQAVREAREERAEQVARGAIERMDRSRR